MKTKNMTYNIHQYDNGFSMDVSEDYNTRHRFVFKTLDEVFATIKKIDDQKSQII